KDPAKHELSRVLNPEKYAQTATIERLQPFNPNKTVVLVIHGLKDSQATWTPMINKLCGDPVIRKHYQFWFYSYPSGYPFPYSAAILRDELDEVEKQFPTLKPIVVIGHSMGGCISRLLLTDSGNELWMKIFGRPPDEVPLSPKIRFLKAMNTIPMTAGVAYDTIIGDRGRGGSPNSSDGVVPYWSPHMNGAQTEDIVPSNHSAHQNPEAIEDVLRILKAHAK